MGCLVANKQFAVLSASGCMNYRVDKGGEKDWPKKMQYVHFSHRRVSLRHFFFTIF